MIGKSPKTTSRKNWGSGFERRRPSIAIHHADYIYLTEDATPFLRVSRTRDKRFLQSHWNGKKWIKGKPLDPEIPYRFPELLQAQEVFVVEGEKDADNLKAQGLAATTSPEGAGKWTPDLNKWLERKEVYVLPDNDEVGKKHAHDVARNLNGIAQTVRIVGLPNLPPKGDVSDWIDAGGTADELLTLARSTAPYEPVLLMQESHEAVSVDDFYALMTPATYMFMPTRENWPATSVDARIGEVEGIPASAWLKEHKPVEQITWAPGQPELIKDRRFLTEDGLSGRAPHA